MYTKTADIAIFTEARNPDYSWPVRVKEHNHDDCDLQLY